MKVELLVTLKGRDEEGKRIKWLKGTILDDSKGKAIPKAIKEEVSIGSATVRLLHDSSGQPVGEIPAEEVERITTELKAARETIEVLRKGLFDAVEARTTTALELQDLKKKFGLLDAPDADSTSGSKKEEPPTLLKCPVPGCENEKSFSENGLKMHVIRMHPEVSEQYYQD